MGLSTPLMVSAALAAAAFLVTTLQDEGSKSKAARDAAHAAESALAPAQAGPEHARLAKRAGTWDVTIKMGGEDGSDTTYKGVDRSRMLGGRWLISDFEADFMGSPFEGHGVMGYDPIEKRYVQTWVDTNSERPIVSEGNYDAKGTTLTMLMESRDPVTGEPVEERHVSRWIDDDTLVFEMYMGAEAHPWVLQVEYKRRR